MDVVLYAYNLYICIIFYFLNKVYLTIHDSIRFMTFIFGSNSWFNSRYEIIDRENYFPLRLNHGSRIIWIILYYFPYGFLDSLAENFSLSWHWLNLQFYSSIHSVEMLPGKMDTSTHSCCIWRVLPCEYFVEAQCWY